MLKGYYCFLIIAFCSVVSSGQTDETHVWKVLNLDSGEKIWYDASAIDTIKGDRFDIWILEVHRPPKTFDGFEGEVFRSKTLYGINLTIVKYGILKVRYYNIMNKEIYSYDYDNPPPDDSIKYTYPVTENSYIHLLIRELYGKEGDSNK